MAKTNTGLVSYAKAQVGLPYWYGTFGQTASSSLYSSKKKQYPDQYTAGDFSTQYGKRVHDCAGLIKGYLWSDSNTATPKYNASQDKSANGLYTAASKKGKISTIEDLAGVLVFKGTSTSKITHVGVYGGDGYIYEAKGHSYGVVKTKYKASDWNYWAECSYISYSKDSSSGSSSSSKSDATTTTSSKSSTSTSTSTSTKSASTSSSSKTTEKKAADPAQSFDNSLTGTYKTTANLNMRSGAGTGKTIMVTLPKSTKVQNYGYYTKVSGVKWLYVQVTYNSVKYTGFCCGTYLKKQ